MTPTARPETREKILKIACHLFSEKGFHSVSVREICEAVGVGKPTLYYYFKDKDALIRELLEETDRISESLGAEFFEGLTDPRECFKAFLNVYAVYYQRYPDYLRFFGFFHFTSLEKKMRDEFYDRSNKGSLYLEEVLKQTVFKGLDFGNLETVRDSIMGAIREIIIRGAIKKSEPKKIKQAIINLHTFWDSILFDNL